MTVLLCTDAWVATPQEGVEVFVSSLKSALDVRADVFVCRLDQLPSWRRKLLLPPRWPGGRETFDQIVYVPRASATAASLLRMCLVTRSVGASRYHLVALQARRPLRGVATLAGAGERFRVWVLGRATWSARVLRELKAGDLPPAVDLERFGLRSEDERQRIRARWGVGPETRLLLHVGHLSGKRGLDLFATAVGETGAVGLVVASGTFGADGEVRERLTSRGIRVIEGHRQDLPDIYAAADRYLFPTRSVDAAIGVPLSVLEAVASGTPVLAMGFASLREHAAELPGVRVVDSAAQFVEEAGNRTPRLDDAARGRLRRFSWAGVARVMMEA